MRTSHLLRRLAIATIGAALATSASVTLAAGTAAAADTSIGGGTYSGAGIDTCDMGTSTEILDAWNDAHDVMVAYLGGTSVVCPVDRNWVQHAAATGWNLLPTYVGLQPPHNTCGCADVIDPSRARQQGIDAGNDAVRIAGEFGIGTGSPLYYDMEYSADPAADEAAVTGFLAGWTETVKANGYRAGVYGDTAIQQLSARYDDPDYPRPDAVWIHWDGATSAYGLPGIPDSHWLRHRTVQYDISDNWETHGGIELKIDKNFVDGDVAVAGDGGGGGEQPEFATGTTHTPGETLTARSGPGTGFGAVAQLPHESTVEIRCQWSQGTAVTGPWGTTSIWDKINLADGGVGYVSDAWVYTGSNDRVAQECGVVPAA